MYKKSREDSHHLNHFDTHAGVNSGRYTAPKVKLTFNLTLKVKCQVKGYAPSALPTRAPIGLCVGMSKSLAWAGVGQTPAASQRMTQWVE